MSFELAPLSVQVQLIEHSMIETDFTECSFTFSNDKTLMGCQPIVQQVMAKFGRSRARIPNRR